MYGRGGKGEEWIEGLGGKARRVKIITKTYT
jgi:hypothetical protein